MSLARAGLRSLPTLRARTLATSTAHHDPQFFGVGEGALVIRFGTGIDVGTSERVLAALGALDAALGGGAASAGVREMLPAYASVMVHFDPLETTGSNVEEWCRGVLKDGAAVGTVAPGYTQGSASHVDPAAAADVVEVPVRYGGADGPDLAAAAEAAGLACETEVVALHASADYRVYFLGFTGGFPYLGGLPEALARVPRLATPRQLVPAGTVGIAAGQTGVYSLATPGGWHLLGRTSMPLFDPSADPPTLLKAGDIVRFVPVEEIPNSADEGAAPPPPAAAEPNPSASSSGAAGVPWIEVLRPGPMTTVQDLGRFGHARHGVSRAGAADALALRTGNLLLGNDERAAGLEVALGGLAVRCAGPCAVALTGADCGATLRRGEGAPAQTLRVNEAVALEPGDELELGFARDGARAYLSVRGGGVDVPAVLGSRSTDLRAGLGGLDGRTLRAGDCLGRLGEADGDDPDGAGGLESVATPLLRAAHDPLRSGAGGGAGGATNSPAGGPRDWSLRVLPGPGDPSATTDEPTADAGAAASGRPRAGSLELLQPLLDRPFDVLPRSDRMAVCLALSDDAANENHVLEGGQQLSEPCASGTIQLPPDGNPLILLAEHQTTGGYKVPGVVVEADLWQVGQMRPGDTLRFVAASSAEAAREALAEQRARAAKTAPRAPLAASEVDWRRVALGVNQMGLGLAGSAEHAGGRGADARPSVGEAGTSSSSVEAPPRTQGLVPRAGASLRRIDLNADAGEGFDDEALLEFVTSVNVACGLHAGDPSAIARTVRLAAERGAGIGAHVSYDDREHFGRRRLDTPPDELRDIVLWQAGALDALCRGYGRRASYIKPHGALYHAVMEGGAQARAVQEAAQLLGMPLLLMPRSPLASFGEGFAERAYDGDALRPRSEPGALIHCPDEAAEQAASLAGRPNLHSICVHGDSPNAVVIARAVRERLEREGFALEPFLGA